MGLDGGLSTYVYVSNNSLKYSDPLGLFRIGASEHRPDALATIVCDGKGGIKIKKLGKMSDCWAECAEVHERKHIEQVNTNAPGICMGQQAGAGIIYSSESESKKMEREAYRAELECLRAKRLACKDEKCMVEITNRITFVQNQITISF